MAPASISHHTSCIYGNGRYIVVFGGYRASMGHLNELWILDLQQKTWTLPEYFGTPPSPRRGHTAAVIGNRMFVFGGYDGTRHFSDLHALDLQTMEWKCITTQGESPTSRRHHSLISVGRQLILYGGYDGKKYLQDLYSLDTGTLLWKDWSDTKPAHCMNSLADVGYVEQTYRRSMHTMVLCGQRLVVFGGVQDNGALNDVFFIENTTAMDSIEMRRKLVEEVTTNQSLQKGILILNKELHTKQKELSAAVLRLSEIQSILKFN
eukprot:Gb_08826 [translate_table: standard]